MTNFFRMITARRNAGLTLCVDLTPIKSQLPNFTKVSPGGSHASTMQRIEDFLFLFCKELADKTAEHAAAFKIDISYFLICRDAGWRAFERIVKYLHDALPKIPIIVDGISGNTADANENYAGMIFDEMGCHAVVLQAHLECWVAKPFLQRKDRGCIFVVKPAPGNQPHTFQEREIGSGFLRTSDPAWLYRAKQVMNGWNENGNCGLVLDQKDCTVSRATGEAIDPGAFLLLTCDEYDLQSREYDLQINPLEPERVITFLGQNSIIQMVQKKPPEPAENFADQAKKLAAGYSQRLKRLFGL